jgi:hypothetical protein
MGALFSRESPPDVCYWNFQWWCPGAELNHRHLHFQCSALPTELPGHGRSAGRELISIELGSVQIRGQMTEDRGQRTEDRNTQFLIVRPLASVLCPLIPRPPPRAPGLHRCRKTSGADRCRHNAGCRTDGMPRLQACDRSGTVHHSQRAGIHHQALERYKEREATWSGRCEPAESDRIAFAGKKRSGFVKGQPHHIRI